ncbi:hypothetical protein GCM10009844_24810 [Nocardioides koreensis]|uniref:LPXTG cell wall anchor domain-containing protein n=1 Tax=Nocardioides koreensis TaxID=433651 RepID=A0ABN2ZU29_9ACTN
MGRRSRRPRIGRHALAGPPVRVSGRPSVLPESSAPGEANGVIHGKGVHTRRGKVSPMVVMIGHAGVYLILALVFLAIIGGGVLWAYRRSR